MTITGPKLLRVTCGATALWRSRIGERRFAVSAARIRRAAGLRRREAPVRDGDSHGFRSRSESSESTAGRSRRRAIRARYATTLRRLTLTSRRIVVPGVAVRARSIALSA